MKIIWAYSILFVLYIKSKKAIQKASCERYYEKDAQGGRTQICKEKKIGYIMVWMRCSIKESFVDFSEKKIICRVRSVMLDKNGLDKSYIKRKIHSFSWKIPIIGVVTKKCYRNKKTHRENIWILWRNL